MAVTSWLRLFALPYIGEYTVQWYRDHNQPTARLQICPRKHSRKLSATDGTWGSKYWFQGFGGLIQGQIYNPEPV